MMINDDNGPMNSFWVHPIQGTSVPDSARTNCLLAFVWSPLWERRWFINLLLKLPKLLPSTTFAGRSFHFTTIFTQAAASAPACFIMVGRLYSHFYDFTASSHFNCGAYPYQMYADKKTKDKETQTKTIKLILYNQHQFDQYKRI